MVSKPLTGSLPKDQLSSALSALAGLDSPHFDLGPVLGHQQPIWVGVNELHRLAERLALDGDSWPEISVKWGEQELAFEPQTGGGLVHYRLRF